MKKLILLTLLATGFSAHSGGSQGKPKPIVQNKALLSKNNIVQKDIPVAERIAADTVVLRSFIQRQANPLPLAHSLDGIKKVQFQGQSIIGELLNSPSCKEFLKLHKKTITHLDASKNELGNREAIALAYVLSTLMSLTSLDLCYNGIGIKGGLALADILPNMKALTKLSLWNYKIGAEGADALRKICKAKNISLSM